MLAVVKRPRTNRKVFEVRGDIPPHVMDYLKSRFGSRLVVMEESELIDITQTSWYRQQKADSSPGKSLRVYRQRDGMTQRELGERLGGLSVQKVSDLENDRRGISKDLAKQLAKLFGTSTDVFV